MSVKQMMTSDVSNDILNSSRGNRFMSQVMVNFRMDKKLKTDMEKTCKKLGLTMTSAFTMFATKVAAEQRIPFDVEVDPFYSKENIEYLKKIIKDFENGNRNDYQKHNLIKID